MAVTYTKLWKLLLDKKMKRTDLKEVAGISSSNLQSLGKMNMYRWKASTEYAWR